MAIQTLSESDKNKNLLNLPGWVVLENRDAIHKKFEFKDFLEAMRFMNQIALVADEMNHHPEWSNVWNRVEITLSTHDCDGLTILDFNLANAIEKMKAKL